MKSPASRLRQLSAAIASRLQCFEEIPLRRDEDCCSPSYSSGPTLYVSGRKDSKVYDIPKEGKATVNYRVRSKSVNYRDDGSESYSTDIEVKSIEPVNLSAIIEKYSFADRARDAGGRYAPGNDISVGDMADAYLKPKKRKAAIIGGAGALAAGAGVLAARTGRGRAIASSDA